MLRYFLLRILVSASMCDIRDVFLMGWEVAGVLGVGGGGIELFFVWFCLIENTFPLYSPISWSDGVTNFHS